jgi:drug/metabolite transporter (DMT)-like permease
METPPDDLRANASAAVAAVLFGASVAAVAVYVNLNPIVAALLWVLRLAERPSALFLVGFAAVVTGVLLVNWPARGADRGPASPP